MNKNYIELKNCIDRGIYKISARNFNVGVFDKTQNGFIGIRFKFDEYLFTEFHWDIGSPFGTVKPYLLIKQLPNEIELNEDNNILFEYLKEILKDET